MKNYIYIRKRGKGDFLTASKELRCDSTRGLINLMWVIDKTVLLFRTVILNSMSPGSLESPGSLTHPGSTRAVSGSPGQ